MFDVAPTELLLVAVVAVLVMGPKELPRALYKLGQVMGKARGMARHFRTGLDAMIREAELEDLQKQWEKQNQQIMAQTRASAVADGTELADPSLEVLPGADAAGSDAPGPDAAPAASVTPSVPAGPAQDAVPESPPAPASADAAESGQPSLPLGAPVPSTGARSE